MNENPFTIHVPATTANIGPGFDCLGLALDLWSEAAFSFEGESLEIETEGYLITDDNTSSHNLIYRAFQVFCMEHNVKPPRGMKIHCTNRIPIGAGLGSSSTAVIMGLYAANKWLGTDATKEDFLRIATAIEGHPDNVAPAIFGGLISAAMDDNEVYSKQYSVADWNIAVVVPNIVLLTNDSRKVLPEKVSLKDAVYNISHAMMVLNALQAGDEILLRKAMQDRLHQPYRLPLIPGSLDVIKAANQAGASAVGLSGAGPALIAFTMQDPKPLLSVMKETFAKSSIEVDCFELNIAYTGAFITEGMDQNGS